MRTAAFNGSLDHVRVDKIYLVVTVESVADQGGDPRGPGSRAALYGGGILRVKKN